MDGFAEVKKAILNQVGCEESAITPEANLKDDLNMDSLDMVELIMALEEAMGIQIKDEDVKELKTVGDVVKFLETIDGLCSNKK
jgi:acyl carrier protein